MRTTSTSATDWPRRSLTCWRGFRAEGDRPHVGIRVQGQNRTFAGSPTRWVSHILEGSVRRAGSRIRVTAQLITASDGNHLWSERYDREMADVFAIQDDIAEAIARALKTTLVARPAKHTPSVPRMKRCSRRDNWFAPTRQAHARASDYCRQAMRSIRNMPRHTRSWHSSISTRRRTPADGCQIAPRFDEPLRARSSSTRSKPNRIFCSGQSRLRTTTTGPRRNVNSRSRSAVPLPRRNSPDPIGFLSTFARFEESTAEMRRAVELDPLTLLWRGVLLAHLACAGNIRRSARRGPQRAAKQRNSSAPGNRGSVSGAGRLDEALAAAERAYRNLPQHSMSAGFYAATLVASGRRIALPASFEKWATRRLPSGAAPVPLAVSEIEECTLVPPK